MARTKALLPLAWLVLLGSVVPFVGLLGAALGYTAWRMRRNGSLSRAWVVGIMVPCVASALAGLVWGWVYAEPPLPFVRAESPRVQSFDGQSSVVEGAFVTGALYPWAERTDVVISQHLQAVDGQYRLRLAGAARETMQVDSILLTVVTHEPNEEVVPTNEQELRKVRGKVSPLHPLTFSNSIVNGEPRRAWELSFPHPAGARAALVLSARTTRFAEEAFARYLATMGQAMEPFMAKVTKETCTDACRREVWEDETGRLGIPLMVSVTGQAQTAVAPVGTELRTFAVELLVPNEPGPLQVRLEATPRFWEITGAWLAEDRGRADGEVLVPASAVLLHGTTSVDVRALVTNSDRTRAAVVEGETLSVTFGAPAPGLPTQSTFIALRAHMRVPVGGRRLLDLPRIAAHRWGLTSLPRFSAALPSPDENASPTSAPATSATPTAAE